MSKIINQAALRLVNSAPVRGLVSLLEQTERPSNQILRVLTYHRIGDVRTQPGLYPRITVSPTAFAEQMSYLAAHYNVLSMPELLEIYQRGGTLPARAALVTFDDAYTDFAEYAWPILQRYRVPVTLFVPTGFPDQPDRVFWWDWLYQAVSLTERRNALSVAATVIPLATASQREQAFSQIRDYIKTLPHEQAMTTVAQICHELGAPSPRHEVLGWQVLRQLAAAGVTMGAHTQNHPLMNRISPQQMQQEAVGSLQDLTREIGTALPIFAYPSGGVNAEAIQVLAESGFTLAFGTERGLNRLPQSHPLCLRRINVGPRTSLPLLRAQLLAWTTYLN